ncbi:hypothetical protein HUT03_00275 [Candidatus Liberibacter africanus]|uniref:Uncharacterized protein n=1 Tax=Candidatus Liberibacter africanus PTSAPSY TaxID=1277257 RepID=A0A0G3I5H1_LIBAF|nr:hypothetical protein [Candidatus Liberibacter africanus]AKK19713.1 hypothetical protein G293_00280 [Candidatus Liberibacter africanus PTSAPSY]QTP63597.1 hypothetical protein HUT03_00275 [Candidatus Liberibacter africanus]
MYSYLAIKELTRSNDLLKLFISVIVDHLVDLIDDEEKKDFIRHGEDLMFSQQQENEDALLRLTTEISKRLEGYKALNKQFQQLNSDIDEDLIDRIQRKADERYCKESKNALGE